MVPECWKVVEIGQCLSLLKSGLSRQLSNDDIGIPVIRSGNMSDQDVDFSDLKFWYIDDPQGANTQSYILDDGDLLINFINSPSQIGKSCLFKNKIGRPCIYTTNILRAKAKIDGQYLFYTTKTKQYNDYIQSITKPAVNQASFTTADFKKYKFPLPPHNEQRKIAQILFTWDKSIATTEQLLANSQQQKKALMQQLLTGKKRLLDNNRIKSRVSKTPYATLPSDWGEISMEEVSSFITKGATPTTYGFDWQDTGIPFLRSECVGEDGFKESGLAFICDEAHEAMKRSKVFTGDLLITITGNVGRVCKLPEHICEANINQHIAKITLNPQQVNTDFIYHCLRDIKYRNYFERITTGQAYPQISLVQVRDVWIPLPSREEQQKIANVLSIADQQITTLQQKLAALKQEKQALMQQLLTGKRRVKVEEAA
ncbi:restriction endonuclease subunit S [Aeromonas veronii]|uniref:restriction endonuclease subunit S n=1 Tax=Aeromonas veronii TaxID=654 RepID=UPI002245FEEF|nr:restriction endonuclease subunit S [Aeromonas veronii]MCX0434565.1 restriction endonuclease subunit S [Aeromonas veronii]